MYSSIEYKCYINVHLKLTCQPA